MNAMDRREFLAVSAGSIGGGLVAAASAVAAAQQPPAGPAAKRPVAISSANGMPAVAKAMDLLKQGADPVDSVVEGVTIVEDDPNDMSVGYGGLPNEDGVVQLDASVMHGPTHKAGAVAALERIRNPARVALLVLRRTDHVLLVGAGALKFARAHGFQEQDLLTDKAREAWLKWKENLNADDDWLNEDQQIKPQRNGTRRQSRAHQLGIPFTTGTIHCAAVNEAGDIGACTSTSGLSYKLAGRVGDSPIVGAGMFVDNEVGAAGATGRGEAVIQSCGAFQIVRLMAEGLSPTDACLKVLRWIADHTRQKYLLDDKGRPNFNVVLYALRKDGAIGSAAMRPGPKFSVHDGKEARLEACAALFD